MNSSFGDISLSNLLQPNGHIYILVVSTSFEGQNPLYIEIVILRLSQLLLCITTLHVP